MLALVPRYVAARYLCLVFVWGVIAIQAAAAATGLVGLQLGGRLWSPGRVQGVLLAASLALPALFFAATPEVLAPGLAGTELMALFVMGVSSAVGVSFVGGMVARKAHSNGPQVSAVEWVGGDKGRPAPTAIVLADGQGMECWKDRLVAGLGPEEFRVGLLGVNPYAPWGEQLQVVVQTLQECCEAGGELLLLGVGLGGLVALAAARANVAIPVVLLDPVLHQIEFDRGLDLLRYGSLLEAWRCHQSVMSWRKALAADSIQTLLAHRVPDLLVCRTAPEEGGQESPTWMGTEVLGFPATVQCCPPDDVVPMLLRWLQARRSLAAE